MNQDNEKENLAKLILQDQLSYEEIGRRYGCSGANIKKVAKKLEIQIIPRRVINSSETFNKKEHKCLNCGKILDSSRKFCNSTCQSNFEYQQYITRWKNQEVPGHDVRYKLSPYVRRFLLEKYNYCCEKCSCNWKNPTTGLSILQIHHIDGDASNCSESNLQVLCPNCHAMTNNYGSLNTSSTRKYRKQDYQNFENSVRQFK